MARFFSAAAVWGRLLLRDVPDSDSWNPDRIVYWDETYLDGVSRLAIAGQKIYTTADLDAAIHASRRPPGIRPLWVREDLLEDALLRWDAARTPARRSPWRARAAVAVAVIAAFVIGRAVGAPGPTGRVPPGSLSHSAAPAATAVPRPVAAAVFDVGNPAADSPAVRRHTAAAPPRARARYAVTVGTFTDPDAADRMRHIVLRKGFLVVVVRRGGLSEVVTPVFATRVEAERVVRGMEDSGIPPEIVTLVAR